MCARNGCAMRVCVGKERVARRGCEAWVCMRCGCVCKEHPLRVCVRGADVHMCEVAGARARNGCARRGVCLRRECVCVRHRWQRCGCGRVCGVVCKTRVGVYA